MKSKFIENMIIFVDKLFEDCWDSWRQEQKGRTKGGTPTTTRTTRNRGKRGVEGEDNEEDKKWGTLFSPKEVFFLFCFVLVGFLSGLNY